MPKAAKPRPVDIKTKVRGISHGSCQSVASRCRQGQRLLLLREPRNRADPNAIAIYRPGLLFKKHLGYVSADIAERLGPRMDGGLKVRAVVLGVTGGDIGKSFGINIRLWSA